MKEIQPKGPYYLAGYSFGACVAMEMALQLQAEDEDVKRLILLDGSHLYAAVHIQRFKSKIAPGSKAAAEAEAMCAFLHQFMTIDYNKVYSIKHIIALDQRPINLLSAGVKVLMWRNSLSRIITFVHHWNVCTVDFQLTTEMASLPDYKSRIQAAVDHLLASNQLSDSEDLTSAADSFYNKLVMADAYSLKGKLKESTEVVLIKAVEADPDVKSLGSDYGLSEVSTD